MIAWSRESMASREELLQSIQPGMKIYKSLFLRIYGYEISFPGFRDTAIKALEDAGCSKAREYYNSIVGEYEKEYQRQLKEAGRWYLEECKNKSRGSEEQRKKKSKKKTQSKGEKWTELSEILNFQPTAKAQ